MIHSKFLMTSGGGSFDRVSQYQGEILFHCKVEGP